MRQSWVLNIQNRTHSSILEKWGFFRREKKKRCINFEKSDTFLLLFTMVLFRK